MNAEDLEGEDRAVRIDNVTREEFEAKDGKPGQVKLALHFRGLDIALLLNNTNATTMVDLFGDETDEWVGKRILLRPTETTFGKKMVPCIRIKGEVKSEPKEGTPRRKSRFMDLEDD